MIFSMFMPSSVLTECPRIGWTGTGCSAVALLYFLLCAFATCTLPLCKTLQVKPACSESLMVLVSLPKEFVSRDSHWDGPSIGTDLFLCAGEGGDRFKVWDLVRCSERRLAADFFRRPLTTVILT